MAQQFIGALQQLIEHCFSPEVADLTPPDFPLAQLDQHEIDKLASLTNDPELIFGDRPDQGELPGTMISAAIVPRDLMRLRLG